jgi:Subtilase family
MQIPVIIAMDHHEPLRDSAKAFFGHRRPDFLLSATDLLPGFRIDDRFAAVPIGTGRPGQSLAALDPDESEKFAVRGYISVDEREQIPSMLGKDPVFADPRIQGFHQALFTCIGTPAVGSIADVRTRLNVAQLSSKNLDGSGVAIAIMDTGINLNYIQGKLGHAVRLDAANSWAPSGLITPAGNHPVDHGSMCAFDALAIAPKSTLLDFPILSSNVPGGSRMGGTLSTALIAYAQLLASWGVAYAAGGLSQYQALVVSNSWGIFHPSWDFPPGHPGRYCDNPRHPFNIIVSALSATGADIVFAAGNCGAQCPDGRCQGRTVGSIMGANASQDVLTIAGCDINNSRVGYSSQGPSITGMYSEKPDVTSYTHFLGSEVFGHGSPDSGTSAACPVAAGCIAALRTRLSRATTPPANLFAQLRATAYPVGQPGWNPDYGYGIIQPLATANSFGL